MNPRIAADYSGVTTGVHRLPRRCRSRATSHVAAAGDEHDVPRHIVGERRREKEDRPGRLLRAAGAAERDHRLRALAVLLWDPQLDELPVDLLLHVLILGGRETRLDEA